MEHWTSYLYWSISVLAILSVLMPAIKNTYWTFRIFDYPRFQKFIILLILIVAWFFTYENPNIYEYLILILEAICAIYLLYIIIPYTNFGKTMIDQIKPNASEKVLDILVCNVYQHNRNYQKLIDLVKKENPSVLFFLETDKKWQNALKLVTDDYKYKIEVPLDNTYGLLFYSHFPVKNYEINYLVDNDIPSIVADLEYNNQIVSLFGIHPTPPVPQENPASTERDAEILLVGEKAEEFGKPAIVFGDLNDVAWSRTTKLFLKSSGMLDPRRGRGMFNTFHAKYWFLRWPLDHFFVSPHFRLVDMKVMKSVDSDHFPIWISLVVRNEDKEDQFNISQEEKEEVVEKIEEGIEKGDAN
ncbi:endonuclease/exonuclease/phosphatase family protein [Epilithonimonas hominis]|uniref:endonuclease/exonuclease/phosphatase family protein n=1 Tax=Epilithonimonas hominis TaxID=420404 RepID=UPI0028A2BB40|nr:endonuclease/exonuclease/phosphatase family protein [Epilithonimonas hominis]